VKSPECVTLTNNDLIVQEKTDKNGLSILL
jgi:hypothetical protein